MARLNAENANLQDALQLEIGEKAPLRERVKELEKLAGKAHDWIDEQLCWVAQDGEHPESCHECADKAVLLAKLKAASEGKEVEK